MSIICSSNLGWVVDHRTAVNWGCHPDSVEVQEPSAAFRCRPDLFAIHHPFMMDTQFEKLKKLAHQTDDLKDASDTSLDIRTSTAHLPSKKRKRKLPLNDGEEKLLQLHKKIKDVINTAYSQLLTLARSKNWLDKTHPMTDNNSEARAASKIVGPGGSLAELSALAANTGQQSHVPSHLTKDIDEPVDLFNNLIVNSNDVTIRKWLGASYIIPARSSFLMSDISQIDILLQSDVKYDVIILDPPWQNKVVKRKRGYSTMANVDLLHLPIPDLAAPGAIIVVWVTNRVQHQDYITDVLFPAWHVSVIGQWYWLKITTSGKMIYDLESTHKKPYEALIIGRVNSASPNQPVYSNPHTHLNVDNVSDECEHIPTQGRETSSAVGTELLSDELLNLSHEVDGVDTCSKKTSSQPGVMEIDSSETSTGLENAISRHCGDPAVTHTKLTDESDGTARRMVEPVPAQRVIMSVPCSIHSRKPPLNEILEKYVRSDGHCLELFARNLIPGWTSWGNEVLKFQQVDYFEGPT